MSENHDQYINNAEKLRFIGIPAYPKTPKKKLSYKQSDVMKNKRCKNASIKRFFFAKSVHK